MIITDITSLRTPCTNVDSLEEAKEIIGKLQDELQNSALLGRAGIGLAAPQIGIHKNIAIIRISKLNGRDFSFNLINPQVSNGRKAAFFDQEGCLSFPDMYKRVYRYQEICVTNYLNDQVIEKFIVTGLPAVVAQHEYDHLIGKLLIDQR